MSSDDKDIFVQFSVRRFSSRQRQKLRALALQMNQPMHRVLFEALAYGLPLLESKMVQRAAKRKKDE